MPSPLLHRSGQAVYRQVITGTASGLNTLIYSGSVPGTGASQNLLITTASMGSVSASFAIVGAHLTNNSATPAFFFFRNGASIDLCGQRIIAASGSLDITSDFGICQSTVGQNLNLFQSQSNNVSGWLDVIILNDRGL